MSKSVYLEKCKRYGEMLRGQAGWAGQGRAGQGRRQGRRQGRQTDRQADNSKTLCPPPIY